MANGLASHPLYLLFSAKSLVPLGLTLIPTNAHRKDCLQMLVLDGYKISQRNEACDISGATMRRLSTKDIQNGNQWLVKDYCWFCRRNSLIQFVISDSEIRCDFFKRWLLDAPA